MPFSYQIENKFYNQEALSSKEPRNLFDPISLTTKLLDSNGVIIQTPSTVRMSRGRYLANIDNSGLANGQIYELRWIYELFVGSTQVKRQSFVYNDFSETREGYCRIYGNISSQLGYPLADSAIEVTALRNGYSTHFSSDADVVLSDAFSNWSVLLRQGINVQIFIDANKDRKFFTVPSLDSQDFDTVEELELGQDTDNFGNLVNP
jgi:hypothetical protein